MKHSSIAIALFALVLMILGSACLADDVFAPSWRGITGATSEDWRFDTSATTTAPESVNNPFGSPSASIQVGLFGSGWLSQLPGLGTRSGYWDLGGNGNISLTIPNNARPNSKFVLLQVTCYKDISQPPAVGVSGATKLQEQEVTVETVPTGGWWVLEESLWQLPQGSAWESVTITSSVQWGSVIDEVVADTIYANSCDSIGDAKTRPDETLVEVSGPVVTRKFETYFYMEDTSRAAGIRVNCPVSQLPAEGTVPVVIGTIRTVNGERVLDQASVSAGPNRAIPGAFGMNVKATSIGLIPKGLLVRLWGHASVSDPNATWFTLNDGSPKPVVVELHGMQPPTDGHYVSVTGVLGTNNAGIVLRVNTSSQYRYW